MISLLLLLSIECSVAVSGPLDVYARAYYLHENPIGERYTYKTEPILVNGGTVMVSSEGIPVAIQIFARPHGVIPSGGYELVSTCGVVPDLVYPGIFSDGFEDGTADAWSKVVN